MEREQKVEVLENLLGRVRANAARPRPTPAMMADSVPAEPLEEEAEVFEEEPTSVPSAFSGEPEPVEDEEIQELELLDDDIVELTDETTVTSADEESDAEELDFEPEEEEPPASSRRPIAASSMDEALADAADLSEDSPRAPAVTPPPESGPQEAATGTFAGPQAPSAETEPTPEQLGQTLELEEPTSAELDLVDKPSVPAVETPDELEAKLPSAAPGHFRGPPAAKPAEPTLPPERTEPAEPPPPVQPVKPPAPIEPEVIARSSVSESGPVVRAVGDAREFKPGSFAELLRASLKL